MIGKTLFILASVAAVAAQTAGSGPAAACAVAMSAPTACAENDNVNIPLRGGATSYTITATHPTYTVGVDSCAADFSNCATSTDPSYPFTPGVLKLHDDGVTVVQAVTLSAWWRPAGMAISVDGGMPVSGAHEIVLYRKILDADSWPQFLVLYEDGNLRLIPQPRAGVSPVCFGASVLIGPAAAAARPFADISAVNYVSGTQTLQINYQGGGSAAIRVLEVDRIMSKVAVDVNYAVDTAAFLTFRSMFVTSGNADTDAVKWTGLDGTVRDDAVLQFAGGPGTDWQFYRRVRSQHNTSAPDIRITMNSASPLVYAGGVVNAASYLSGAVAPGEAVSIFGCGIGPGNGSGGQPDSGGMLGTVLGGVSVAFDGVPAPLLFVQAGQVNALVPYSVGGKASTLLQIGYASQQSQPVSIPVAGASPAIFTMGFSGVGAGAVLNQDGTLNSKTNPAARGSVVQIFGTGDGLTNPPGVDGQSPVSPLPKPRLPVSALVDGLPAVVHYAGAAPGLAGCVQVNAQIPDNASTGSAVPVSFTVGTWSSQAGVTIAIQ